MSRSYNEKSIPHRYRKGKDGGVRKSVLWEERWKTKKEVDHKSTSFDETYDEEDYTTSK